MTRRRDGGNTATMFVRLYSPKPGAVANRALLNRKAPAGAGALMKDVTLLASTITATLPPTAVCFQPISGFEVQRQDRPQQSSRRVKVAYRTRPAGGARHFGHVVYTTLFVPSVSRETPPSFSSVMC